MKYNNSDIVSLTESLRQAHKGTLALAAVLKKTRRAGRQSKPDSSSLRTSSQVGSVGAKSTPNRTVASADSSQLAGVMTKGLTSALRTGLGGSFASALRSMLGTITRSITGALSKSVGGGPGGSLLSSLVGGGLSMLVGKLFKKRQVVKVDNTVRAEVLNFPRLSGLDLAVNPASRLFGGRALARGPAFSVSVEYKGGAEDIVAAKVATKLSEINFNEGVV